MSQIIGHDVKIWWRHISVKNVGIALKLLPNLVSFRYVDHDLQKYRHLQITYDITDVSCKWHSPENYLVLNKKGLSHSL